MTDGYGQAETAFIGVYTGHAGGQISVTNTQLVSPAKRCSYRT